MNKLNFKYLFPNLFLFCICMNLTACSEKNSGGDNLQSGDEIISFEPDLNTLIRNPASGWTLYDDANDYVAQANTYWNQQGAAAEKYASIFYWRSRWSELEPEEGKYAWEHDENFKALIQGALDRGLKLALCRRPRLSGKIREFYPCFRQRVRQSRTSRFYRRLQFRLVG